MLFLFWIKKTHLKNFFQKINNLFDVYNFAKIFTIKINKIIVDQTRNKNEKT